MRGETCIIASSFPIHPRDEYLVGKQEISYSNTYQNKETAWIPLKEDEETVAELDRQAGRFTVSKDGAPSIPPLAAGEEEPDCSKKEECGHLKEGREWSDNVYRYPDVDTFRLFFIITKPKEVRLRHYITQGVIAATDKDGFIRYLEFEKPEDFACHFYNTSIIIDGKKPCALRSEYTPVSDEFMVYFTLKEQFVDYHQTRLGSFEFYLDAEGHYLGIKIYGALDIIKKDKGSKSLEEKDTWHIERSRNRPPVVVPESLSKFKKTMETMFHDCGVPINIEDGFCHVNDDEPSSEKVYMTDVQVTNEKRNKLIAGGSLGFCGHPILTLICMNDTCRKPHTIMSTPLSHKFVEHFFIH